MAGLREGRRLPSRDVRGRSRQSTGRANGPGRLRGQWKSSVTCLVLLVSITPGVGPGNKQECVLEGTWKPSKVNAGMGDRMCCRGWSRLGLGRSVNYVCISGPCHGTMIHGQLGPVLLASKSWTFKDQPDGYRLARCDPRQPRSRTNPPGVGISGAGAAPNIPLHEQMPVRYGTPGCFMKLPLARWAWRTAGSSLGCNMQDTHGL
jgi:hypothetical protein